MRDLSQNPLKLVLPLGLCLLLSLACSRFPLGRGADIPGPSTVAAEATQTAASGLGQALPTAAPPTVQGGTATPSAESLTAAPPTALPAPTAVDGARPRLPAGQPLTIVRVDMLDAAEGWAVGHAGADPSQYVLRTSDGGHTWVDVSPPVPPGPPYAAVAHFFDANHAWVILADAEAPPLPADPAVVWRTSDGGQTWEAGQPLDLAGAEYSAPSALRFVDPQRGWLLTHVGAGMNHDYVMLFTTGDGGQTWDRIADPQATGPGGLPMSCGKTGLGFLSPQVGWVTGDCHGVAPGVFFHRTGDGGRQWQPQVLPPPPGAANLFTNETIGCGTYSLVTLPPQTAAVALLCQDLLSGEVTAWLYTTPDAGQTWQANALPGRELFFLDAGYVWSVAEGDVDDPNAPRQLYRSDDGGQSWAELTTVTWSAQLDFINADLGWAVATAGAESALVQTADGGLTWQLIEPALAE